MQPNFNWRRWLARKQLLVAGGYALVLAIFSYLGWQSAQQLNAEIESQRWVNHTYEVRQDLSDLLVDLTAAETGQRGFLITGNEQYLEPYTVAITSVHQRFADLQRLTADDAQQKARLASMEPIIANKLAELQRTIELRRTAGFDAAMAEVLTNRGKTWMDQLRQKIAQAQTAEEALLRARSATMLAHRQSLKLLLLLGTLATAGLLGMLMVTVGEQPAETLSSQRSVCSRYGVAVGMSGLICLALWLLIPVYGGQGLPLVSIGLAVAAAAWWGGLGPGLLTTALCSLFSWWALVPPAYTFELPDLKEGLRLLFTVFACAVISALAEASHRAAAARQASEAQLARANAGLEQKVHERTEELRTTIAELEHFSYALVHDMRAPLRSMRSFADMLLMTAKSALGGEEREYLRRIATSARLMDDLILDALAFSEAVRTELPLSPVEPATLLEEMLATYPDFQAVKANIHIAGDLPPVLANRAGLTQVFSNLLRNAIKFVAPGVPPDVQVSAAVHDGWVRLWFADNGIGIAPEFRNHLFEMFQRASPAYEGTGIGLALVRKITQRMGGKVGVESEPGQGSRFWIEFRVPPA